MALQKPVEDKEEQVMGTVTPLEYIMEIITNISDVLKLEASQRYF